MSPITDQPAFRLHQGTRPLLLSLPHVGTYVPPGIAAKFTDEARQVPDTDWHLETLYDFAVELGASVLVATHSRYVIDMNRPPDNTNLYPGQNTTSLCPVDTFDDTPVYLPGQAPDDAEIQQRVDQVWRPYHQAVATELARLRSQHEVVAMWEGHSIRSVLPRLFEGTLPDLNLGTARGASADDGLAKRLLAIATSQPRYTAALNGRFTGGYLTREYGRPEQGVHTVQLEMTQCSYMEEKLPFAYLPERANQVKPLLREMLETALAFAEGAGRN